MEVHDGIETPDGSQAVTATVTVPVPDEDRPTTRAARALRGELEDLHSLVEIARGDIVQLDEQREIISMKLVQLEAEERNISDALAVVERQPMLAVDNRMSGVIDDSGELGDRLIEALRRAGEARPAGTLAGDVKTSPAKAKKTLLALSEADEPKVKIVGRGNRNAPLFGLVEA